MLESIVAKYYNVRAKLIERKQVARLDNIPQASLQALVNFLTLIKRASDELSSDCEPTLHLVVPWYFKLHRHCNEFSPDASAGTIGPTIYEFARSFKALLKEKGHLSNLHYIATLLHPKMKQLSMLRTAQEKADTHKELRNLLKTAHCRWRRITRCNCDPDSVINFSSSAGQHIQRSPEPTLCPSSTSSPSPLQSAVRSAMSLYCTWSATYRWMKENHLNTGGSIMALHFLNCINLHLHSLLFLLPLQLVNVSLVRLDSLSANAGNHSYLTLFTLFSQFARI